MKKFTRKLFKMNLQLFNGLFDPNNMPEGTNPLFAEPQQVEQPIEQQEQLQTEEPRPLNEQQFAQQPVQPMPDLDSYFKELMTNLDQKLESFKPQEPIQEPPVEPTPEELEAKNQQLVERLMENPLSVIEELKKEMEQSYNQRLEEAVKPYKERFDIIDKTTTVQQNIEAFRQQHPDFEEYAGDMKKVLEDYPELQNEDNPLKKAYEIAKGRRLDSIPKSFDDYLKDDNYRKQILENPEIKQAIVENYLKSIKDGQPPVVISGGGSAIPTPQNEPQSIQEAGKNFRDFMKSKGLM